LQFRINPDIKAEDVANLRSKAGWGKREDKLEKILGNTYLTVACFDRDRLVGFVDVISDGIDDALIRNLIVDPDYQRKGVALKLLSIITKRVREDGIKTINVLFEPALKELYLKAGFTLICGGIIDNEERPDCL